MTDPQIDTMVAALTTLGTLTIKRDKPDMYWACLEDYTVVDATTARQAQGQGLTFTGALRELFDMAVSSDLSRHDTGLHLRWHVESGGWRVI